MTLGYSTNDMVLGVSGLQVRVRIKARVRSAGNVTVITCNLPHNLHVGKIENYA